MNAAVLAILLTAAPKPSLDGTPLAELAPRVFADPATTPDERARLASYVAQARQGVAETLGPLQSETPLVIFCKTVTCDLWFAGTNRRSMAMYRQGIRLPGAQFVSPEPTIVILRVDAGAKEFLQHELTHREVHQRLGPAAIPAWFDDGLAMFVSHSSECGDKPRRGIDDLRRLSDEAVWSEYTNFRGAVHPTYCQAFREVSEWVGKHGPGAVPRLIAEIAKGKSFDELYGPLVTASPEAPLPVMSMSTTIGDKARPFSLALWLKPRRDVGVLAHLTATPVGTGWAIPLLGFDASGHLVSQMLIDGHPELSNFSIVTLQKSLPLGKWSQVVMTWTPGGKQRLYVDGTLAAEAPSRNYFGAGADKLMYVTWGSYNQVGSDAAWCGAIGPEPFDGDLCRMQLFDRELSAAEVAQATRQAP